MIEEQLARDARAPGVLSYFFPSPARTSVLACFSYPSRTHQVLSGFRGSIVPCAVASLLRVMSLFINSDTEARAGRADALGHSRRVSLALEMTFHRPT